MSWKKELDRLEVAGQWAAAVHVLERSLGRYPDDVEFYIRSIYLLLNLLLEEDYSAFKLDHDDLATLLKKYFENSHEKFRNNAEYLFFVGYFMSLAEWYFGQEDLELSHEMLKRAAEMEPDNPLYQWAYKFVLGDGNAKDLCKEVMANLTLMTLLESKGNPGRYLVEILKNSCEA